MQWCVSADALNLGHARARRRGDRDAVHGRLVVALGEHVNVGQRLQPSGREVDEQLSPLVGRGVAVHVAGLDAGRAHRGGGLHGVLDGRTEHERLAVGRMLEKGGGGPLGGARGTHRRAEVLALVVAGGDLDRDQVEIGERDLDTARVADVALPDHVEQRSGVDDLVPALVEAVAVGALGRGGEPTESSASM